MIFCFLLSNTSDCFADLVMGYNLKKKSSKFFLNNNQFVIFVIHKFICHVS